MGDKKKAVVLLSGGLDSTTALAIAMDQGFQAYGMTFRYGQRHDVEIQKAKYVAEKYGIVEHVEVNIDLRVFGKSALTADIAVPKDRSPDDMTSGVPVTYVPARNTIFLSFALAWAEVLEARDIFIGVNALDYSGYPDCRPEYIEAYRKMADLATREGVEGRGITIHTPLINWTKAEIIRKGVGLGVNYADTLSCYDATHDGLSCGHCDSCLLRMKGFREAGIVDPTPYRVAA